MKSKIDKLDVDKLVPIPIDWIKLSDVVKNAKKDVHNAKIKNIEDKISDITILATNATLNAKTNEVNDECIYQNVSITNLATFAILTTIKNKRANVSNLVKKLTITQKLMKLKTKLLIMKMINILLLQNLIR